MEAFKDPKGDQISSLGKLIREDENTIINIQNRSIRFTQSDLEY